jgi:hypothetical protein
MKPNETKNTPLCYHLRFQLLPGRSVARDAAALAEYCREHAIEEAVLFFAAEEWNNGLLSRAEEDLWFRTLREAKRVLDRSGIAVSLNPWMTVLHCARGRSLPKDRRFQPMVSPLGEMVEGCASLACPNWRKYIRDLYGRFAQLGFRGIWVEDDFRSPNHGPVAWGGGFEPAILRRFARKIGKPLTRQQVVRNLTKPGAPHPWRARWLETWRELQLETADEIARAVEAKMPRETKLGLMSSNPGVHSIEGRDWHKLFAALTIGGEVAHRPNFASYDDWPGMKNSYSILMLDRQRAFRPARCEVAPEIENFPFTQWNKSDRMTWTQMALAIFYSSDALLLDLFPFSGNRPQTEPRIGEMLDRSRPALEWIAARFDKTLQTQGVGLPWREDTAAHVRTDRAGSMRRLFASSFTGGDFLLPYGIPVSAQPQHVNALFGKPVWALDDAVIERYLRGGLFLDGTAADIPCQRGFARHVGLDRVRVVEREEATYSIEKVLSAATGLAKGFYFNHNLQARVARLQPAHQAHEWTTLLNADGSRFGAAMVAFENNLGNRVVTLAACESSSLLRSDDRQTIVHRALDYLRGKSDRIVTVTGGPHLMPIQFENDSRRLVVIFNGSVDPAKPVVKLPGRSLSSARITLLSPLQKPVSIKMRSDGGVLPCDAEVPYLGYLVIEY